MFYNRDKQKSPPRRFLLIIGGLVFAGLVTFGLLIIYDNNVFPGLENPRRTWFGILILIFAVLRTSRIFIRKKDNEV